MQVRTSFLSSGILAAMLVATAPVSTAQQPQYPNQPQYQGADEASGPVVDPPGRVARIAVIRGDVSLEPAGVDQFSQAELNYPLTIGDRVYADVEALTELQTAGLSVRLGNAADLTISTLTDQVAQLGLAQGSIRVRTRDLQTPDGTPGVVEIDTPNGTILVNTPGDFRVDFYPQNDTTVVTVTSGEVRVQGENLDQTLGPNESMRMVGNPPSAQYLRLLPPDALDKFDQERDQVFQRAYATQDQYVSPDMIGSADLAQYGDWAGDPDYGNVWYPRGVDVDWAPYHNGHWAYIVPWGWTWVGAEPWGFAPFHYGRWAVFGGRWGWVPGPPTRIFGRPVRPVYSPALVAFVGGPGFSLGIGVGGRGGLGVTAWFPLGPREPYRPWYRSSTTYVNRVNVTNIYNRNPNEVRDNYNNRTRNVYERNDRDQNYQNRGRGTTAVSQRDFSDGRRVDQGQRIRMDDRMRQQVNQAPVMVRPTATPSPGIRAPQTPARAVPPSTDRPRWEDRGNGRNPQRQDGNPGGNNQPGNNRGGNNQPGNNQPGNPQGNPDRGRQGQPTGNPGQPTRPVDAGRPIDTPRPADAGRPTEPARVITPPTANPPRPTNQPRNDQPSGIPAPTQSQPPNDRPVRNREPNNPQPIQQQPTQPAPTAPQQQRPPQQQQQDQQRQQLQQQQDQQRQQEVQRQQDLQRQQQQDQQKVQQDQQRQQLQQQQEQQRQQQRIQDQQRQDQQRQEQQRQQQQRPVQPQPDQQEQQRQQQEQQRQQQRQQQLQQQQVQQQQQQQEQIRQQQQQQQQEQNRQQQQRQQQDQQRQQQRERDQPQNRPQAQPQPQPARPQPQPEPKAPPKPATPPS